MNAPKIHPFEERGLGKAPFRYVGCYEDRGPHRHVVDGVELTVGSPGQPMGTCDYCGQGIAICCRIESADGKSFVVGSDCVLKTTKAAATTDADRANAKMRAEVNRDVNARRKAQRHLRDAEKLAAAKAWIDANADALDAIPNPKRPGETLRDQAEWFWAHAGTTGKLGIYAVLRSRVEAGPGVA